MAPGATAGRSDRPGWPTIAVRGVTNDSRAVRPGSLFVAIPGLHVDGHDYRRRGRGGRGRGRHRGARRPRCGHPAARRRRGAGGPRDGRGLVVRRPERHSWAWSGITGTDGKTTTSFLAMAALEAAGIRTGMTGTAATRIGGVQEPNEAHATTPGRARRSRRRCGRWSSAGDRAAVIETTSHGLALDRVDAIAYDVAILTNLTHEHLELHGTWEAYRDAKLQPVRAAGGHDRAGSASKAGPGAAWPRTGIVNADDPSAGAFIGVDPGGRRPGPHLRHGSRRGRPRDAHRGGRPPPPDSPTTRRPGRDGRASARRPVQRPQRARGRGPRRGARPRSRGGPRGPRLGRRSCPAGWSGSTLGQPFGVIVDFAHSPASLADGPRPARPARRVAGRRSDRGLRVGRRARHGQAAGDGPDRRRTLPARGRHRRGPARRGPDRDPRRDRGAAPRPPAGAAITTCWSSPTGARRSRRRSSAPDPATSSCSPARATSARSSAPTGPVPWDERAEAEEALRRAGYG